MIDLQHEMKRELSLIDPPDLWARIQEEASLDDAAAVLDLTGSRNRRHPARWLAVAAVAALLALVGVLAMRADDDAVDTVPATGGGGTTTTEEPKVIAFAAPFNFDLGGWTLVEQDLTFYHFAVGPEEGLPATRIDFGIPEAATPEAAVADLVAEAPSLAALGDPVEATVGNLPATCMDVEAPEGDPDGTPLVETRSNSPEPSVTVVLEAGAMGRVCVVDAPGLPQRPPAPLVVLVQAPRAEAATFLAEAEGLLRSVKF